jgi:hypothetical protein
MRQPSIYFAALVVMAICFPCKTLFAQEFTLPEGFHTLLNYDDQENRISGDFDLDGRNDLAIVCASDDESDEEMQVVVVVYLSKKWFSEREYYVFPWYHDLISFSFEKNVLSVYGNDCAGRCSTELKFKYYEDLQNMKLIGYDEGHLPDYSGQGAYDLSVNLNTGMYQIGSIKKKVTLDLITLPNVEYYFEQLGEIGSDFK